MENFYDMAWGLPPPPPGYGQVEDHTVLLWVRSFGEKGKLLKTRV